MRCSGWTVPLSTRSPSPPGAWNPETLVLLVGSRGNVPPVGLERDFPQLLLPPLSLPDAAVGDIRSQLAAAQSRTAPASSRPVSACRSAIRVRRSDLRSGRGRGHPSFAGRPWSWCASGRGF